MNADRELVDLARELPWQRPDEAQRESVRAGLLAAADAPLARGSRLPWLVAGTVAAAAAAIVFVATRGGAPVPAPQASIAILAPSDYDQLDEIADGHATEVVHLRAGHVRIAAPDPVRVDAGLATVTADAGGAYEIAMERGALASVSVEKGRAQIVIRGQRPIFLAAGQTWKAPIVASDLAPAALPSALPSALPLPPALPLPSALPLPLPSPSRSPSPPRPPSVAVAAPVLDATPPAPAPVPASHQPTETEQRFAEGWALLRAGHFNDAATQLAAAVDAGGDQPLAEDARYFEAVALARAGRGDEAEHVLTAFLDKNPRSLRRGRAAVMLGWLYAQRGQRDAARTRFDEAARDPDEQVAASARAGLAALDAKP